MTAPENEPVMERNIIQFLDGNRILTFGNPIIRHIGFGGLTGFVGLTSDFAEEAAACNLGELTSRKKYKLYIPLGQLALYPPCFRWPRSRLDLLLQSYYKPHSQHQTGQSVCVFLRWLFKESFLITTAKTEAFQKFEDN
jgi:hypothetical protein